jgi:hypothetical protein
LHCWYNFLFKIIKNFKIGLGDAFIAKILPIHIQEMINHFSKTHSQKTCENLLGAVN